MATLQDILQKWLDDKKDEVRKSYEAKGLKASGSFGNSLATDLKVEPTKLTGVITGNDYGYFMQNGRRPTSGGGGGGTSLRDMIRQWIDDKGLVPKDNISKDSLAFLIARKIHRDGITVPNPHNTGGVFSDVFTPQSFSDLIKICGSEFLKNVKSDVIKTFS